MYVLANKEACLGKDKHWRSREIENSEKYVPWTLVF